MNKRTRQYIGLFSAIAAYYLIHEGAHLLYALAVGTFKDIRFLGLGVQIDIFSQLMTQTQLGIFCLLGSVATTLSACILTILTDRICAVTSKLFKACGYYITIAMLLLDPLYLSLLCGFFGGGDMNGISLLIPEPAARVLYAVQLVINGFLFFKIILPKYTAAFTDPTT